MVAMVTAVCAFVCLVTIKVGVVMCPVVLMVSRSADVETVA